MKKLTEYYDGVYSLMLTPYHDDLTIDYNAYEKYCEYQAASGVEHLFCVCGTSEMAVLTLEERIKLAELTAKHKNDLTIVATANMEPSWFAQVEEVKRMSQTGVDGLVFTTKGFGEDPERLVSYVGELKQYTDLPVFMYEFPGLQPHKITGEAYGRLVRECGVYGIKDTTCTIEGVGAKIQNKGESCIIQANMPYLFESFKLGARGIMSTPTACGSAFFARFYDAFVSGDMALAERRYWDIMRLDDAIGDGFNMTAKYLVSLQGVEMNWINRYKGTLAPQRLQALRAFHDWAVSEGLMN